MVSVGLRFSERIPVMQEEVIHCYCRVVAASLDGTGGLISCGSFVPNVLNPYPRFMLDYTGGALFNQPCRNMCRISSSVFQVHIRELNFIKEFDPLRLKKSIYLVSDFSYW